MYVDEVGNSDPASSENPLHRFLSLTGVIVDLNYVSCTLHPQMEQLKSEYFDSHPDDPVIFHRKELLNSKYPFKALRDPETRSRFDSDLLGVLNSWEYTVISVCLDKKSHKDTYHALLLKVYFLFRTKGGKGRCHGRIKRWKGGYASEEIVLQTLGRRHGLHESR
ncbi:MAG: hypothetical protein SV775_18845 [Thermodesulfobacteriota bacterium]|nr:hypothetical protein [Thermodesulfobacteriota bacterium]